MLDIKTTLHYDEASDVLTEQRTQDAEPILNSIKEYVKSCDGYSPSREMRFFAEIPNVLVEKWLREDGINVFNPYHLKKVKAKLAADAPDLTNTNKSAHSGIIIKGVR